MTKFNQQGQRAGTQYNAEQIFVASGKESTVWDHAFRSFVGGIAGHLATKLVEGVIREIRTPDGEGDEETLNLTCIGVLHRSFDGFWFFCNRASQWWTWDSFHGWCIPRAVPPIVLMGRYYKDDKGRFFSQTSAGWFLFIPENGWEQVSV